MTINNYAGSVYGNCWKDYEKSSQVIILLKQNEAIEILHTDAAINFGRVYIIGNIILPINKGRNIKITANSLSKLYTIKSGEKLDWVA